MLLGIIRADAPTVIGICRYHYNEKHDWQSGVI